MTGLCYECGKRKPSKNNELNFFYKGLSISTRAVSLTCDKCAKEIFKRHFKEYRRFLVYNEKETVLCFVDWRKYCEYLKTKPDDESSIKIFFVDIGILSFAPAGNWEIISDNGLPLNPRIAGETTLYFTNFKDVIAYAREKYWNTAYGWEIHKIEDTYMKDRLKIIWRRWGKNIDRIISMPSKPERDAALMKLLGRKTL